MRQILASELSEHKAHGDYIAGLSVDGPSAPAGDSVHFRRIGDALAAARSVRVSRNETTAAACRITVTVAPGVFRGSTKPSTDPVLELFPLAIDVPKITLIGSFKMQIDAGGRATGSGRGADTTLLLASPALVTVGGVTNAERYGEPMVVVNSHPNGSRGDGAVIEGFVFNTGNSATDATPGGIGLLSMRASDISVIGNRFGAGLTESIDLRASSGRADHNYLSGRGGSCGICLAGPGEYQANGNRLAGPGGIPGFLVLPSHVLPVPPIVEPFVVAGPQSVIATITNNEVRNHQAVPVGVGLRFAAEGIGSSDVPSTARVVAKDNTMINNRFGIIIEAGFPVANTGLRGDMDVTLSGNTVTGSCQADLLVSFARHQTGLGLQNGPYLRNSTYRLTFNGSIPWQDAWYANPEGMGNTLVVDGQVVANGIRNSYNAARTCP